jgi:hypothetical protein
MPGDWRHFDPVVLSLAGGGDRRMLWFKYQDFVPMKY